MRVAQARSDGGSSDDPGDEDLRRQGAAAAEHGPIAKAVDTPYRPKPGGHRVKFNLEDADLAELVNHISGLTGKRFIYGGKVRKIKHHGRLAGEGHARRGLPGVPLDPGDQRHDRGPARRFLKIVESGGVVRSGRRSTRAARPCRTGPLRHAALPAARRERRRGSSLLAKFKSKDGDITVYGPATAHHHRHRREHPAHDPHRRGGRRRRPAQRCGSSRSTTAPRATSPSESTSIFELGGSGQPAAAGVAPRVLADEQTNSLIIVGTERGYLSCSS